MDLTTEIPKMLFQGTTVFRIIPVKGRSVSFGFFLALVRVIIDERVAGGQEQSSQIVRKDKNLINLQLSPSVVHNLLQAFLHPRSIALFEEFSKKIIKSLFGSDKV